MAEGFLDIGTLTGTIELDDRLTGSFETVIHGIEKFADEFLGSFKGIAVGLGLVTTAITGIAATISTLAVKGSEINDVKEGFDRLSGGIENADALMKAMRTGVVGTVTDLNLMRDANRLLSAGVKGNAEDFQTLTTAAHVLANEGYGRIEDVLGSLNRAMITGSTFRIKQLGVSIDATKVEREYAASLGISAQQLTREQTLEAMRSAILDSLNTKVAAAGELHLSFAEKLDAALTSLKNWAQELESLIASSPAVNAAFDAIANAITDAFGGEGQSLIQTLVGWVNEFADVVRTWAPPIIKLFGEIKDTIKSVWDTINAAWDTLPDWLKTVVKDATVAAGALFLTEKALDSLLGKVAGSKGISIGGDSGGDTLGQISNIGTITSALIDSGNVLDRLKTRLGGISGTIEKAGDSFSKARGWVNGLLGPMSMAEAKAKDAAGMISLFGTSTVMTGVATGGLVVTLAAGAIALGAVAAVVTNLTLRYKLYQENQERAAAATRQAATDQSNIARITELTGKTYTNLADAMADANKYIKEHKKAWDDARDSESAAKAIAEAHKKSVDGIVASLVAQSTHMNETVDVFNRLTTTQKLNRGVQDELIKRMEDQMASGQRLTDNEKQYYESVTRSRAADTAYAAGKLVLDAATIASVKNLTELNYTEAEIAQTLGISTEAVKNSKTPLLERIAALEREGLSEAAINERLHINADVRALVTDQIKRQQSAQDMLTTSTDNYNLAITHNSFAAWKKNQDDMMATEIRNLRQSKDWTQESEDAIQNKYKQTADVKKMQDREAFAGSRDHAIAERDTAKNLLDTMLMDSQNFHTADIQAAQQDYNDKSRAVEHWAADASEAEKKAAEAAKAASEARQAALKKEMDAQNEWAENWHNLNITMTREQAEGIAATTGGDMWAQYFRTIAQQAIKALDEAELTASVAQFKTREELQKTADLAKKTYDTMLAAGKYTAETLQDAWQRFTEAQQAAMGLAKKSAEQTLQELAEAAGFKTRTELEKLAAQAKKTYDFMLSSGKYTAQQLEEAWKKYTDAQNDALGVTAGAAQMLGGAVTVGRSTSSSVLGLSPISRIAGIGAVGRVGPNAVAGGQAVIQQNNTFNVNGTDEQSVRKMSDMVMKNLRVSRMLPG